MTVAFKDGTTLTFPDGPLSDRENQAARQQGMDLFLECEDTTTKLELPSCLSSVVTFPWTYTSQGKLLFRLAASS